MRGGRGAGGIERWEVLREWRHEAGIRQWSADGKPGTDGKSIEMPRRRSNSTRLIVGSDRDEKSKASYQNWGDSETGIEFI